MYDTLDDYLLEIEGACEALHMSRNCVYAILKSGELKGYQQGRIWKIPKEAIIQYIREKSGLNT